MRFKSWKESVAKEIGRMIDYGQEHPLQATVGSVAVASTTLLVLYSTPLHEYTIDPVMNGIEVTADWLTQNQPASDVLED